jgi:preprotein translocase subunit SecB
MRPRSSPLLLKDYFTTHLSFSAQSEFMGRNDPNAGKILASDLKVDVEELKQEGSHLQRSCHLTIELDDPTGTKYPCVFSISLVGFFEVISDWPTEQVDILFTANAPAVLYSAAREALASITGRSPFKGILLPSVTFVPLQTAIADPVEEQITFPNLEQLTDEIKSPSKAKSELAKKTSQEKPPKSSEK